MNALEGTVTGVIAALVERGHELGETQRREAEAARDQRAQYEADRARTDLASALEGLLGITVERSAITVTTVGGDQPEVNQGATVAQVEVDGCRFAYGFETQDMTRHRYHDAQALLIERVCSRKCEHPLWVPIYPYHYDPQSRNPLTQLHDAVTLPQAHRWPCLQKFDEDGNPVTDWQGNPLPKPEPKPRVMSVDEVHDLKTDVYANLLKLRRTLQFDKAVEKEKAIARIIASGEAKSYTAAEKVVESDPQYAALCHTLTVTIGQEVRAKEELLVARAIRTGSAGEKVGGPEESP